MAEMNAKYSGSCRKCGCSIKVGERINWTRETGATHVKCPEIRETPAKRGSHGRKSAATSRDASQVEQPPSPVQKVLEAIPAGIENETVTLFWSDGEYLSGWMPSGSKPAIEWLEKLGLCHYVDGWGTHFESDAASETLVPGITIANGGNFTVQAADDIARPGINARYAAEYQAKMAKIDKRSRAFAEANRTGNPVVLRSWSEDCDGSTEECDIDNITQYAMPDGSIKTTRNHSW